MENKNIGNRIRDLRNQRSLTQDKVAEELHISLKHYSEVERGVSGISTELIIDMASYYNVTIDYLLLGQTNNIEMGAEYNKKYEQLPSDVKNRITTMIKTMIDFCYMEKN